VSDLALQMNGGTVAVISTVLPGTMAREIVPLLPKHVGLAYNPSFIAMGTTVRDFLQPEFVLVGGEAEDAERVWRFYRETFKRPTALLPDETPIVKTSVANAELTKVAYNTFIGLKLAFANTVMEVCHKTDCDVDEVMGALKLAKRRLISGAYLDGGMGDGGGCHPRDNIALSWLARKLDLSFDLFDSVMHQRQAQCSWLADRMELDHLAWNLPMGILGTAYKPGSAIETGSPALLVKHMLEARGRSVTTWDPHVNDSDWPVTMDPHVWLIGCKHPELAECVVAEGSVVIDPWRYYPDRKGVEVVRLGQGARR
jgi:UDPglucose 6-dehydrogenase